MMEIEFIGRYRVGRRLGEGAFAEVFLAIDEELESPVAIKVLARRWSDDEDVRERFLNEARLLRRLGGARLVAVHDIGELPDGRPYFVMPYADRGTLEDRLAALAGEQIPASAAYAVARDVALALRRVHEAGVVHRDVKPGNLLIFSEADSSLGGAEPLIAADERLVLGDFGLAKDLTIRASGISLPAGTPGYMAPEQSDAAAAVDERADVYACSALLTRILTGRPPGAGSAHSLPVGPAVRATILSGLDPQPASRQPSAGDWLVSLDKAVAADSTGVRPARRRRRAAVLGVAMAVLIASLGIGLIITTPEKKAPAAAAEAAVAFVRITDDTGKLSVDVPATWSQHWGNGWHPGQNPFFNEVNVGPGMNASPNVSDWFTDAAVPGLFAGISSKVVAQGKFTPDYMAQYFGPKGCTAAGRSEFRLDRLGLTGTQGEWTCGGGVHWRYAYGWPDHHRWILALEIKMVTAEDDKAWDEALRTVGHTFA
ncbi:serine/threonine protein kinase [Actinoplanes lutulentus]|uniref:non-specific serine/threonine protein kinase n=1 Tax=Actinoplanes lutulentus TaxID=1287878 RepID=A0A327Z1B8_9ACTN|nr:serine/threonine-protein kinase [Actinoplanes lutulentus]MBB2947464.1 serine/threonine protein kinase [Actinoplanes lutulentus]RAK28071.1 serine/threonine protein kinase [Actinoplanes lutulentus]